MRLACVREGEHRTNTCLQVSFIDEAGDMREALACDIDKKEGGFDTNLGERHLQAMSGLPRAIPKFNFRHAYSV